MHIAFRPTDAKSTISLLTVCLFAHENECPHLDLIFQHKKEEPEEERYLAGTPSGKFFPADLKIIF